MIIAVILISLFMGGLYPQTMTITEVNETADVVICTDYNGNEWSFEGSEDWICGDKVAAIMHDHGTEIIYDDIIIDVRYSGR